MIPFSARTHPGLRRSKNEDNFETDADLGLWIVADGVGGHSNGEVASEIACTTIREQVAKGSDLRSAIENAHQAVLREIDTRDAGNNMGTTVVALQLRGDSYEIAWVGDSRAYLFDGGLKQLTRDHSAVNDLIDSGAISKAQAAIHPQRHALSRSLGVSSTNASSVSVIKGKLGAGEQILLCSDGLTDELADTTIIAELTRNADLESQVDALVSAALASGGRDNLTLVLLGSPRQKPRSQKEAAPDLEVTQNIAARLAPETAGRRKTERITLLLFVLVCIILGATLI
ncbi:MAG: serine/threonine protein phosphatase PrpC [Glaciecola sp.]|jgi:serine/threonine protein phosphatase PrpC|uniref:PP2C family protein-serine/threonine phosphatase n=1 Tax=Congregibacter sp. TaxID=2744308 RepID=UPI0039E5CD06